MTTQFLTQPSVKIGDPIEADIVIVGGSFGAPAAALAAARQNPSLRVVLLEPMEWLGGQATSQGVSAIDNAWHDPAKAQMRDNPRAHYAADYLDWLDLMRQPSAEAPGFGLAPDGTCWVSRESYDPRTGAWALDQLCARHSNLRVIKRAVVKDLATEPDPRPGQGGRTRITNLTAIVRSEPDQRQTPRFLSEEWADWFSVEDSNWFKKFIVEVYPADPARGLVVVDASETSDAIVLSGADYTIGRELETEAEAPDGALPAMDEDASQATVFCFCMTGAVPDSGPDSINEIRKKLSAQPFDDYVAEQERSFYSLGSHGFHRVWTYRRLKTSGPLGDWDHVEPGDVTMQNWNPGNDYPYASIFKNREGADAEKRSSAGWQGGLHLGELARAEMHALGFFLHMARLCREKAGFEAALPRGAHRYNMMGTWNGLAMFPYIRCGRRIVGLDGFRITQETFADSQGDGRSRTSHRFFDSVGIGSYASDVHPIHGSTGVGCAVHLPSGFYIPYRALASRNVSNLLSGCKSMAATYWVNSAYRLHPIEWAAGSAAGVAAAHMAAGGLDNRALLEPERLRRLQESIAANSPIHWPAYDSTALPGRAGDVLINRLRKIQPGQEVGIRIDAPGFCEALVECDAPGFHLAMTLALDSGRATGIVSVPGKLSDSVEALTFRVSVRSKPGADMVPLDEVRVEVAAPGGLERVGAELRIDPGSSLLALTGEPWTALANGAGWSTDAAMPGRVATYSFPELPAGAYELVLHWPASDGAAKDTFVLVACGASETQLRVDQSGDCPPDGYVFHTFSTSQPVPVRVMINNDVSEPASKIIAGPLRLRRTA